MQRVFRHGNIFALVIGLTDGILTALTLASGRVFSSTETITISLALRISAASSVSGVFVFFTAEYMRQRGELVHAERQLSLTSHLAATQLGRAVLRDTLWGAAISSVCNFMGALLPLTAGALFPRLSWLALAVGLMALAVLGMGAARSTYGNPVLWVIALVIAGGLLTLAGWRLHVT
jgi:predicted membrane protein (TIGR00267 family)